MILICGECARRASITPNRPWYVGRCVVCGHDSGCLAFPEYEIDLANIAHRKLCDELFGKVVCAENIDLVTVDMTEEARDDTRKRILKAAQEILWRTNHDVADSLEKRT